MVRKTLAVAAAATALLAAPTLAPAQSITPIHDVQGAGAVSPRTGDTVSVEGIVTAVGADRFFLQAPDAEVDADPATSEGLLVFTSAVPGPYAMVGNRVRVTGPITEFVPDADPQAMPVTRIESPSATLQSTGNPLPEPVPLTTTRPSPNGPFDQLESNEGMRVSVASLTVTAPTTGTVDEANATATSNGVFHGVVTGLTRPLREAGIRPPDVPPSGSIPPIPRWDGNPETLRVDSDAGGRAALDVASGATVTGLVGPLDYVSRRYTIIPTETPGSTPAPTPAAARAAASDEVTIATLNLQRFADADDDPAVAEPVLSSAAYDRRLTKASAAIRERLRSPDVLAVQEVEDLSTLQALAARVNSDAGQASPAYVAYLAEGNDDAAGMDVGFLVATREVAPGTPRVSVGSVTQLSSGATYADPATNAEKALFRRPPLRLVATLNRAAGLSLPVRVLNVQLERLGEVDAPGATGQSARVQRREQAEAVAELAQAEQTASPSARLAVLGDFDAIAANDGYVDVVGTVRGTPVQDYETAVGGDGADLVNPDLVGPLLPGTGRYTVVEDGTAAAHDHVLVSAALAASVVGAEIGRIGADLPETERNGTTFARATDHDGVVTYLEIPAPPVADAGGPYTVPEGGSVGLDGSATDADGDTLTFAWDLDEDTTFGETGETGEDPTFSAAGLDGPATRTVHVRASDGGLSDDDNATVTVTNVAPTASVAKTASGITLGATDPSPADTAAGFTWTVDWGDTKTSTVTGTAPQGASHTYDAPGTYTVSATARDKDGATGAAATTTIVVPNPPVANAGGPYTVAEGGQVKLNGSATDPDSDELDVAWDLDGDAVFGEAGETGEDPVFSAAGLDGPAVRTVVFRASDGGRTRQDSATVTVTNVAPVVSVAGVSGGVTLGATDPSSADTAAGFTWTVDWGDGMTSTVSGTAPQSASHAFAAPGTYAVSATARDKDGATGAPVGTTIVVPALPAPPVVPPPAQEPIAPVKPCVNRLARTAKQLRLKRGERITAAVVLDGRRVARRLKPSGRRVAIDFTGLRKRSYVVRVTVKKGRKSRTLRRTVLAPCFAT